MKQPIDYQRPQPSPAELAKRVRILARALQQGVQRNVLLSRGYKELEVEKAKAMIGGKK